MTIQNLSLNDVEAMAAIHRASMERHWDVKSFSNFLNEPAIIAWGYFSDTILQGFILSQIMGDEMEILTLAVDSDYRRQGIARHLVQAAIDKGADTIFLEVNEDNEIAQKLYLAAGFEEFGRREKYYQTHDGLKDAVLMRRNKLHD